MNYISRLRMINHDLSVWTKRSRHIAKVRLGFLSKLVMHKMVIIFIRNEQNVLSFNASYWLCSSGTSQRATLVIMPVTLRIKLKLQYREKFAILGFCSYVNKPTLTNTRLYRYLRSVQVQIYRLGKKRFENVQLLLKSWQSFERAVKSWNSVAGSMVIYSTCVWVGEWVAVHRLYIWHSDMDF